MEYQDSIRTKYATNLTHRPKASILYYHRVPVSNPKKELDVKTSKNASLIQNHFGMI